MKKRAFVQFDMNYFNAKFRPYFNPKIEPCNNQRGNYVIKFSISYHEYFWLRKDAKAFLKNYTKEL